jgi:hypothetical protein
MNCHYVNVYSAAEVIQYINLTNKKNTLYNGESGQKVCNYMIYCYSLSVIFVAYLLSVLISLLKVTLIDV